MKLSLTLVLALLGLSMLGADANLLNNPDFEDGLRHWGISEWSGKPYEADIAEDKSQACQGEYAAKIQWISGGDNFVLSQEVALPEARNYLLSFQAKAAVQPGGDATCHVTLRFFDDQRKAIGDMVHKIFNINENYQLLQWSFTAPDDAVKAIVCLRCRRITTWFDCVRLVGSQGLYLKNAMFWPQERQLVMELFNSDDGRYAQVEAELLGQDAKWQGVFEVPSLQTTYIQADLPDLPPGKYLLKCSAKGYPEITASQELVLTSCRTAWPAPYDTLKVRNNFVTELLVDRALSIASGQAVPFQNPRRGWVRICFHSDNGVSLALDHQPRLIKPDDEAMLFLDEGNHRIVGDRDATLDISITTMGECIASEYETNPVHINLTDVSGSTGMKEFLRNSNVVMERYPNNNVLDQDAAPDSAAVRLAAWRAQGRHAITNVTRTGYDSRWKVRPEDTVQFWGTRIGMREMDGISIDEFGRESDAESAFYAPAVDALTSRFPGRTLYAYTCAAWYAHDNTKALRKALLDNHHVIAPELYMREQASEAQAKLYISDFFNYLRLWEKAEPSSLPGIIWTYGSCDAYFANYCLDNFASADYRVFLDLQFFLAANDPELWGLRGVCPWIIRYTRKDTLLWTARLVRHYLIEGKRTLLSQEYDLHYNGDYLRNPDFADGLASWQVQPAAEGTVFTQAVKDYGFNRGTRNTAPDGDTVVVMKRIPGEANRITQTLRNLKPGKYYEINVRSCDYNALIDNNAPTALQLLPLRLTLQGAEVLADKSMIHVYPIAQKTGRSEGLCGNHTNVVFKATAPTGTVVISDETPNLPHRNFHGFDYAPVNPELPAIAFNFVQVTELLEEY